MLPAIRIPMSHIRGMLREARTRHRELDKMLDRAPKLSPARRSAVLADEAQAWVELCNRRDEIRQALMGAATEPEARPRLTGVQAYIQAAREAQQRSA